MPWTVKDVDEHKKGLTPAQKKKWVSVANGVLKKCQSEGGKDCEGKAIRIANSKFEETDMEKDKMKKVPKGALRFVEEGFHAFAFKDDGDKPAQLRMTAYNGKVIKGHWYWGDLAIDLSGMSFRAAKFPILENHDTDRKIGFHIGKPDTSESKLELIPEKTRFVDTPFAQEFIKLSADDGFPYQASIYAKPTQIQRLMEKETAEVNGMTMHGPGTIWRKCEFKEASVCVFGWDSDTRSSAFSRETLEDVDIENVNEELTVEEEEDDNNHQLEEGGEESMNLEELKTKHPDLVIQLSDEVREQVKADMEAEFAKEREKFTAEKSALETKIEDGESRLAELEKKETLREERDRKTTADEIWKSKLSASEIDDYMFDKVQRMVSFTKFVKDDTFDVEAFSKAVDDEIADWESRLSKNEVFGMGSVGRKADGDNSDPQKNADENSQLTNDLLARAGQQAA